MIVTSYQIFKTILQQWLQDMLQFANAAFNIYMSLLYLKISKLRAEILAQA